LVRACVAPQTPQNDVVVLDRLMGRTGVDDIELATHNADGLSPVS
jgi:hypothetical protein